MEANQTGKSWEIFKEELATKAKGTQWLYEKALMEFLTWLKKDAEGLYQMQKEASRPDTDQRDKNIVSRKVKSYMVEIENTKQANGKFFSVSKSRQVSKSVVFFLRSNGFEDYTIRERRGFVAHDGSAIVSKADIRRMLELTGNFRTKALLKFLSETGVRISDALTFNVGSVLPCIDADSEFCMLKIVSQKKTRRPAKPICGPEAMEALKKSFEERRALGEKINSESPLFVDMDNKTTKTNFERLGRSAGSELVRRIAKKAGLKKVSAHSLRKFAITQMQIGKVPQMHISVILGKVMEGSWGEYTLPTDQELLTEYKGAYANLAVYEKGENIGVLVEQQKRIEELEKKYTHVEKPYIETYVDMKKQMDEMRKELDSMRKSQEEKQQADAPQ